METLFLALFTAGIITTLIAFVLIPEDTKKIKNVPLSVRPLYLVSLLFKSG